MDPSKVEAYYGRGFVKAKLGDPRGAIEDYSKAAEIGNNESSKIIYDTKMTKVLLDELRNGVQDKVKIAEFSTERAEVYFNRGSAKAKSGDAKQAMEDYNRAIALNPIYAEAYFFRGVAKSNLGDQRNAIQDCSNAIKLNPKYAEAYYVRGIIKLALSDNTGCMDLSKSGELGYNQAYQVIREHCN
jgi:tetratricopeptide (TPR) repeat protein